MKDPYTNNHPNLDTTDSSVRKQLEGIAPKSAKPMKLLTAKQTKD